MTDPFFIVEPPKKNVQPLPGEVIRGDDWIMCHDNNVYVISYLAGHFSTKENKIIISNEDAKALLDHSLKFSDLIKKYEF
jgi:hypothetical protein